MISSIVINPSNREREQREREADWCAHQVNEQDLKILAHIFGLLGPAGSKKHLDPRALRKVCAVSVKFLLTDWLCAYSGCTLW